MTCENYDALSLEEISSFSEKDYPIYVYDHVDSTNIIAQELAMKGAPHGTLVLAESQEKGRGRLGRSFFSPKGSGIYMSMVIKPTFDISKSVLITVALCVAVSKAIEEVTGNKSEIKWVNDIYINERKVCGILCQASTGLNSGKIDTIIAGIGINCRKNSFPEELKDIAGYVPGEFSRNLLIAKIADNIISLCENIEEREFIDYYRKNSMVLGRDINVIPRGENPIPAKAVDIDEDGGLIVIYEDGRKDVLTTGEVSIRIR